MEPTRFGGRPGRALQYVKAGEQHVNSGGNLYATSNVPFEQSIAKNRKTGVEWTGRTREKSAHTVYESNKLYLILYSIYL